MNEEQIVYMNVEELIPYENNPRFNEKAVEPVAKSIKEYGFNSPIAVDKNKTIINGHTRLLAAKKLGLERVPVIVLKDLTDEQVKAYRLADNKVSEFALWDNKKLLAELDDLTDKVYTGFDFADYFYEEYEETYIEPLEENEKGITYTVKVQTQDKDLFEKIKIYLQEVAGD